MGASLPGKSAAQQTGSKDLHLYQVTDLPFPIRSRDVIFHVMVTYNQDRSVLVSLQAKPQRLEETRYVRITDAFGYYLFQPLAENRTRMTWQLYVDPAGSLPAWVVNSMLTEIPTFHSRTFAASSLRHTGMRRLSMTTKASQWMSPSRSSEPEPGGFKFQQKGFRRQTTAKARDRRRGGRNCIHKLKTTILFTNNK